MDHSEVFLSAPIGKGISVSITKEQFDQISRHISDNPVLVRALEDFKERWIEANESDDPNAFAGSIDHMNDIRSIVEMVARNPDATILSSRIIMKYLKLS